MRIFMLGNGPSLLQQRHLIPRLQRETTYGCNGLYEWDAMPIIPTFYGISSNKKHRIPEVNAIEAWRPVKKFILGKSYPKYGLREDWIWIEARFELWMDKEGFKGMDGKLPCLPHGRATPLTQAQVAASMGFREFYFLGNEQTRVGHVYGLTGPKSERRKMGGLGPLLTEEEWEKNERDTFASFARARKDIEEAGGTIVDCTPDGRLVQEGILPYAPLEEVLA